MTIAENGVICSELVFTVTANFTAEPLADALRFWIERLWPGSARVEFSGYNQVFQELVSQNGLLASSYPGVNFILVRLEDWAREQDAELRVETIVAATQEFIATFGAFARRAWRPTILLLCPSSQEASADVERALLLRSLGGEIRDSVAACHGVIILDGEEVAKFYPVENVDDAESDRQGHIPFTEAYWAALGTALVRTARTFLEPPRKVIAVDADNTLWHGVAAEMGATNVQVTGVWREIQEFLLCRKSQGMLLALVSKNREEDVAEVFRRRDMALRREDFVAWEVNWKPKSENLRNLAAELDLGLDSFIFLDDNPTECAEVAAHCPSVGVLQLPQAEGAMAFLRHVWAFDLPPSTSADTDRTEQYRQRADRKHLQAGARSFQEFFQNLDLRVEVIALAPDRIERAAQLTQRTNQFNATGLRRTAAELASLLASGEHHALMIRVRDRFGDYGDVGLCVYSFNNDLEVENFLLSCRVLGKGVEHQLLAALGRIAEELGKPHVVIPLRRTERNEPIARFLENVGGAFRQGDLYCFPAAAAKAVIFDPAETGQYLPAIAESHAKETSVVTVCDSGEIARSLATVPEILLAIKRSNSHIRPALATDYVAPRNVVEGRLAEIWADVLGFDRVGIHDNFFDLGGDSIQSIQIVSRANQAGLRLTLRQHFQFPEIADQVPLVRLPEGATRRTEPIADCHTTSVMSPSRFSLARLGQRSLDVVVAKLAKTQN